MFVNVATVSFQAATQPRLPLATIPFVQADIKLGGESLALKQTDIRGPAFLLQFRNHHTLAVSTRYRADLNISSDYDLVRWFQGDKTPLPLADRSPALNADAFGEIALSYAVPIINRGGHAVKIGATYKHVRGLQTAAMSAEGSFEAKSDRLDYTIRQMQVSYSDLLTLSKLTPTDAILGTVPGIGNGFDLGFTYEFRPQAPAHRETTSDAPQSESVPYKYRFGVSLLDMGSIRYKSASIWRVIPTTSFLLQTDVQPPKTPTQIRDAVARTLGVLPEGEIGELNTKLPQTLSVQFDANVGKNWFLSGTWWKPTTPITGAQHRSELITLGGRYETAKLEYSAMLNYWQDMGKVSIGTHVRYGYVTIGSDNLFGFFSYNNMATHLFAGVSIPIGAKLSKPSSAKQQKSTNSDSDGDGIADQLDLCPDVAGIQAFQGCPDTDKDGIQDIEDNCPQQSGPLSMRGCPDADGDGIADKDDACPRDAGPAAMKGCPDSDGDGIANNLDECPTIAGPENLHGCPDSDGDGLSDNQDRCSTEFGLKELGGCALADIAPTDTVGLLASEKSLLNQLRTNWIHGPEYASSLMNTLQEYLAANPKRMITMVFTGSSQAQTASVLSLFKNELSRNSISLDRFKFSGNVAVNYKTGLKLGITNTP
ncbi:hypothetical protein GCM10027592_15210 [Spirosoma flavus]